MKGQGTCSAQCLKCESTCRPFQLGEGPTGHSRPSLFSVIVKTDGLSAALATTLIYMQIYHGGAPAGSAITSGLLAAATLL